MAAHGSDGIRKSGRMRAPTQRALFNSVDMLGANLTELLKKPDQSGTEQTLEYAKHVKLTFAKYENESRCLEKKLSTSEEKEERHELKAARYRYITTVNFVLDTCRDSMKGIPFDSDIFDALSDRYSIRSALSELMDDDDDPSEFQDVAIKPVVSSQGHGRSVDGQLNPPAQDATHSQSPKGSTTLGMPNEPSVPIQPSAIGNLQAGLEPASVNKANPHGPRVPGHVSQAAPPQVESHNVLLFQALI